MRKSGLAAPKPPAFTLSCRAARKCAKKRTAPSRGARIIVMRSVFLLEYKEAYQSRHINTERLIISLRESFRGCKNAAFKRRCDI
jgi:hypothetical protein